VTSSSLLLYFKSPIAQHPFLVELPTNKMYYYYYDSNNCIASRG